MTVTLILNNKSYSFRATNAREIADNLIWCLQDSNAPDGLFEPIYKDILQTLKTEGRNKDYAQFEDEE